MARQESVTQITLPAAADYSTKQYHLMDVNTSAQAVLVSSQGAKCLGSLMNDPAAAGRAAQVAIAGVVPVMSGDNITVGARVTTGADGRAELAASADLIFGIALSAGNDGEIISVLMWPGPAAA